MQACTIHLALKGGEIPLTSNTLITNQLLILAIIYYLFMGEPTIVFSRFLLDNEILIAWCAKQTHTDFLKAD